LFVGIWPTGHSNGLAPENTITPQLLLNLSAAGAAIGYTLGLLASLYSISSNAENLVYRTAIAPSIFALWVWGLADFANPSAILSRIVASIRHDTTPVHEHMPVSEAEELLSTDWTTRVIFIYDNNFPFLDATPWTLIVAITLLIVTILVLIVSATRRYKANQPVETPTVRV